LQPWRSPYLRWRIETYWGWHAEEITPGMFLSFVWKHRAELARYVKWAAEIRREVDPTRSSQSYTFESEGRV
jgi:hypothetical protein